MNELERAEALWQSSEAVARCALQRRSMAHKRRRLTVVNDRRCQPLNQAPVERGCDIAHAFMPSTDSCIEIGFMGTSCVLVESPITPAGSAQLLSRPGRTEWAAYSLCVMRSTRRCSGAEYTLCNMNKFPSRSHVGSLNVRLTASIAVWYS